MEELYSIYLFSDTEVRKRHSNTLSAPIHTCNTQPHDDAFQPAFEFGKVMCDLIEILQNTDKALELMVDTFEYMARYMESKVYKSLVTSNEYKAVNSVRTFFRLLAPYLEPVECSLLTKLVAASCCEKAIKRLDEYLLRSQTGLLGKNDEKVPVLSSHDLMPEKYQLPRESVRDSNLTSPEPKCSNPVAAPENNAQAPIIHSQPVPNAEEVPVVTTVAANQLSWGALRDKCRALCGVFSIPCWALRYLKNDEGSVVIWWVTSTKIASHIQSIVLDDSDMDLLKREMIVKVQVGTEYTIVSEQYVVTV